MWNQICIILLTLLLSQNWMMMMSKGKVEADGQIPRKRATLGQLKETGEMCEKEGGINDSWIEDFKDGCKQIYDQESSGDPQFRWELKKASPDLFHVYIERVMKGFHFKTIIIAAWSSTMKYIGTFSTGSLSSGERCDLPINGMMKNTATDTCLPGDGEVLLWRPKFKSVFLVEKAMIHFQLRKQDYETLGLSHEEGTELKDSMKNRFYFIAYIAGEKDCYTGRRSPVFKIPTVGDGSGPLECNYAKAVSQVPVLDSAYDQDGRPLFLSTRWVPTTTKTTQRKSTTSTSTQTTTITTTTTIKPTTPKKTTQKVPTRKTTTVKIITHSSESTKSHKPTALTTQESTKITDEPEEMITTSSEDPEQLTTTITTKEAEELTTTEDTFSPNPMISTNKITQLLPVPPPRPTRMNFKNITLKPVKPGIIVPLRPPPISEDNNNEKEEPKPTKNKPPISVPEMYDGCGKKKGCIGDPAECIPNKSCQSVISYGEDELRVRFQIMGKSGKYIAIGLSRDQQMGNDSVVECVRGYGDQIFAYMSWNYRRDNRREKNHSTISDVKGSYVDGFIICEFWRLRQSHFQGESFDLDKEKFFVLHARGNSAVDGEKGNIGYHDEGASFTKTKYMLNERFTKRRYRLLLENVHSSLLIGAWVICFPVAAFISRYYKETYMNRGICGYTIWYSWHTILTWLGTVLTIVGVAGVFIDSEFALTGMGSKGWNTHNITGVTLLIIILLEIITGYIVKGLNYRRSCQLCNYIHGFLGHSSFFVAFANMYESTGFDSGLPCSLAPALISWIVMYLLIHLIMSYQVCYVDFIRGSHISRAYNCFKIKSIPHPHNEDVPGSPIRKLFLGIFVTFSIIFAVALVLVNLLSLDEETCGKTMKNLTKLDAAASEKVANEF